MTRAITTFEMAVLAGRIVEEGCFHARPDDDPEIVKAACLLPELAAMALASSDVNAAFAGGKLRYSIEADGGAPKYFDLSTDPLNRTFQKALMDKQIISSDLPRLAYRSIVTKKVQQDLEADREIDLDLTIHVIGVRENGGVLESVVAPIEVPFEEPAPMGIFQLILNRLLP